MQIPLFFFIFIFCSRNIKATLEHSKGTLLFLFFHMHQTMTYDIRYIKDIVLYLCLATDCGFLHLKNAIFLKDTYPAMVLNEMNAHIGLVLGLGFVQDLNVIQYTSLFSTVSKNCISQWYLGMQIWSFFACGLYYGIYFHYVSKL